MHCDNVILNFNVLSVSFVHDRIFHWSRLYINWTIQQYSVQRIQIRCNININEIWFNKIYVYIHVTLWEFEFKRIKISPYFFTSERHLLSIICLHRCHYRYRSKNILSIHFLLKCMTTLIITIIGLHYRTMNNDSGTINRS